MNCLELSAFSALIRKILLATSFSSDWQRGRVMSECFHSVMGFFNFLKYMNFADWCRLLCCRTKSSARVGKICDAFARYWSLSAIRSAAKNTWNKFMVSTRMKLNVVHFLFRFRTWQPYWLPLWVVLCFCFYLNFYKSWSNEWISIQTSYVKRGYWNSEMFLNIFEEISILYNRTIGASGLFKILPQGIL